MTDSEIKAPIGLVKRPKYDPVIEQLNDKQRDIAAVNTTEAKRPQIDSNEMQSPEGRTAGLREHGERIRPDKSKYLGSICVHLYANDSIIQTQATFLSVHCGLENITSDLAAKAIQALANVTMQKYGHKPPGTLDTKARNSKIIRPV